MIISSKIRNFLEQSKELLKNDDLFTLFLDARHHFGRNTDVRELANTLESAGIQCKDTQFNVFDYLIAHEYLDIDLPQYIPIDEFSASSLRYSRCGLTYDEIHNYLQNHADNIPGLALETMSGTTYIRIY